MFIIKNTFTRNTALSFVFAFLALLLVVLLTGCGAKPVVADPQASAAAAPAAETPAQAPPTANNFIKQFGDVVTYDDGISISVSEPIPFTPSNLDYMPLAAGDTAVVFKLVLTNNSAEPFEPGAVSQASSGGKPANMIADVGNTDYPQLGLFPTATVLPGQTIEWYVGFGISDPAKITFDVAPYPIGYEDAIFTNIPF